ncbi:MAG: M1 family aminopeptidase [candidate division Zixibacteria bacterium]|nr:M1 family aminopeptidase [candidate division Zixibacteria bacterium]MDH3938311.1 M1 family aminopeptidase [candidate division Zixibacteria bacterium]MDH4033953.1 M1 family aminopeptidase [candidate division Zixibacteria bacterium]
MTVIRTLRITLTAALLLFVTAATALSQASPKLNDGEIPNPREVHKFLSEGKSRGVADRVFTEKLLQDKSRTSTQTNYDVKTYDIAIRVNDTIETIFGRVGFRALATEDGVSQVEVDLLDNMPIDSIISPAGALSYSRLDNTVTITLDQTYNTDQSFEFDIYYWGEPEQSSSSVFNGFAWHVKSSGEYSISTVSQPYGARSWWPCKDRMDDKADSFFIAITADSRFYVASTGTLDSTVFGLGHVKTYYFTMPYPMASYLFAIGVSDYAVWYDEWIYNNDQDTMPVVHAVDPAWFEYSQDNYDVTPYALTILSDNYGLYPFTDVKYGHASMQWYSAMEHQSMSWMLGSHTWGYSEPVVVHELGHQWWGDYITCESWSDIWLNEGWASYSEALYYQVRMGWNYYHDYMDNMDYAEGTSLYRADTTWPNYVFSLIVYDKGAWVCHMLRGVLGDSLFFQAINDYYNSQYAFGALTTLEFRDVWEQSSGMELDWFFDQWIFGEYRPYYYFQYWVEASAGGGYDVFLAVDQVHTTDPQVFKMPVDFTFETNAGDPDTLTLWVNDRSNTIVLNFPDSVTEINLDPRGWILKYERDVPWYMQFVVMSELPAAQLALPYETLLDTRGGTGSNTFSISGGALPTGLSLDSVTGLITGTPTDTGLFTFTAFVDDNGSSFEDEEIFTIYVEPTPNLPGDMDLSGELDIADLIYFVDYNFSGGPPPPLMNLADVDGSCAIDIADMVYLVDYMFAGGPAPLMGCVE